MTDVLPAVVHFSSRPERMRVGGVGEVGWGWIGGVGDWIYISSDVW